MKDVPIGATVQHTLTPFKGVVVCRAEWLNGCIRLAVQSPDLHEGKPVEPTWLDEHEVEMISQPKHCVHEIDPGVLKPLSARQISDGEKAPGGPRADPKPRGIRP